MKTFFVHFSLAALLLISIAAHSQAPTVSYSSPQTYLAGFPITSLTPTGTGLANLAYGAPATLLSGLAKPDGVAIDASGNIYYSSITNNTVYKLAVGTTTPVSYGTGFSSPAGLALDASGNLYVADNGHGEIKKIPAGGGTPVSIGAVAAVSVACDLSGNVYVTGPSAGGIYKIAPGGSPVALVSPTTGSSVSAGTGLAVDQAGNVYYSTGESNIIKYATGTGILSQVATGVAPYALAVDASGNIFCSEEAQNDVKMVPADGSALVTVGIHTNGAEGIALDANDNVYVADKFGPDIKSISPIGGYFIKQELPAGLVFSSVTGAITGMPTVTSASASYTIIAYNSLGSGSTTLNITVNLPPFPTLSYASPKTYPDNSAIIPLMPTSSSVAPPVYGNPLLIGSGYSAESLAMDVSGNMYIDNVGGGGTIYRIPAGSTTAITIATGLTSAGALAVDGQGNLFIADGTTIQEIAAGGNIVTSFAAGFETVTGVATDVNGNVYLTDRESNLVEKIPAGGGAPVPLGSGFNAPLSIAVDPAGDIFVTDQAGEIKKIPASGGSVITIATYGAALQGLAADASGNVFVSASVPALGQGSSFFGVVEYPANGSSPVNLYYSSSLHANGIVVDTKGNVLFPTNSETFNQSIMEFKPIGGYYFNSLPAGLKVNPSTGVISGTPTTTKAATNYTGIAYNLAGNATSTTSITIANPYLSGLTLSRGTLSPAFAPATTSYSAFIGTAATSVTVTPTVSNQGYTITVNGTTVASGHASPVIPLTKGPNTITVVVTAADGINKTTYTLIAGTGSDDAYMSTIKLNNGATPLSPSFAFETLNYTASVGNGMTSATVTPKVLATGTTITVNGAAVTSGSTSTALPLNVGPNTITVVGRAQDSVTYTTYTIVVTRAASSDAYLSMLSVNTATLSPSFAFKTLNYTSSVPNGTSQVTVKAAVLQANATIQVNGTAVTNKTDSPPIALAVGSNTITILVTAQDGVTTETYTVTLTRASGGADSYSPGISVSNQTDNPLFIGEDIKVHPGVSPNGDGIDDVLIIENINNYPDNKVMIMDRNGAIIYQATGYDNLTKAFDGHSNLTGRMQLPGTYFYALDYTVKGVAKRKTGFIVLKY